MGPPLVYNDMTTKFFLKLLFWSEFLDMLKSASKLNIVRIGSYITYSSLKKIGAGILKSFLFLIN